MKVRISKVVEETDEAKSFYFSPTNFFNKTPYVSGQFMTVEFRIDKKLYRRAYSLSSSPSDKYQRITVKRVANGVVSNYMNDIIKVGDTIEMLPAAGSFKHIPESESTKEYILFAGGSGVTPILSIIKSILRNEPKSKILFFYANKNPKSTIFLEEISSLELSMRDRFRVKYILEEENELLYSSVKGYLTVDLVKKSFLENQIDTSLCTSYMCGPIGFMEMADKALLEVGIERESIYREIFEQPKIVLSGADFESKVKLTYKDQVFEITAKGNETILQAFINQNIIIPFSCRSGQCNTCKAKCRKGEVKMSDGNVLTKEEIDAGEILTCISYPKSEAIELVVVPSKLNKDFDSKVGYTEDIDALPVANRNRQKIGSLVGLAIAFIGLFLLSTKSGDSIRSIGPMNTGHEELSCNACHVEAKGSLTQQINSNFQHLIGTRKHPVDFGSEKVDNFKCMDCHNRPNDRHPTDRFLEPRFSETLQVIDATQCANCHKEHNETRLILEDGNFCINCHADLEVTNDPLDISHMELIAQEKWESCLQCHDFHGNHLYDLPKKMNDTIPLIKIMNYFKGDADPYSKKKKYDPLSEEQWLEKKK